MSVEHKVLQWNTLADQYSDAFPKVDQRFLQWPHRSEQIRKIITANGADLIGLQEVDHFDDFFQPTLKKLGYEGAYISGNGKTYGCSAFYDAGKYLLFDYFFVDQSAAILFLQIIRTGGGVVFVTTHLKAKEPFEELRMQQSQRLIAEINRRNVNNWPVIIAGDLNTEPSGRVIPLFLQAGYTSAYPLDRGICTTIKYRESYCARMIDYILASGIRCSGYSPLPNPQLFDDVGLPAEHIPSDHFCLSATFEAPL